MIARLDVFNYYNYYHTTAAHRDLTPDEQNFFNFCMEYHEEICAEDTPETIISQASELWMKID